MAGRTYMVLFISRRVITKPYPSDLCRHFDPFISDDWWHLNAHTMFEWVQNTYQTVDVQGRQHHNQCGYSLARRLCGCNKLFQNIPRVLYGLEPRESWIFPTRKKKSSLITLASWRKTARLCPDMFQQWTPTTTSAPVSPPIGLDVLFQCEGG